MNVQEFIGAVRTVVIDASIRTVEKMLIKPAGRQPDQRLVEMSEWFNKLSDEDKNMVLKIVKESVEMSAFGFLCVLDGVAAIEDDKEKGRLDLYYNKEGKQQLLNNPEEEYLHNLL